MRHNEPHPLAGKTVTIATGEYAGMRYRVEDYWDRVAGKSWMNCDGNPACLQYAMRTGTVDKVPTDDEVLYGKLGPFGHLIHVSEIEAVTP